MARSLRGLNISEAFYHVTARGNKQHRHGQIQNILATHGYENTDGFFNMVLCVFMVKRTFYSKADHEKFQTCLK